MSLYASQICSAYLHSYQSDDGLQSGSESFQLREQSRGMCWALLGGGEEGETKVTKEQST